MSRPVYAVATCGEPLSARLNRAAQSSAADSLLKALSNNLPAPLISSKSHSRAVAAVCAASWRNGAALGIDIEYADEARPMREIINQLPSGPLDDRSLSQHDFYRLWTFAEAHFKAFGAFPDATLMRETSNKMSETTRALRDGVFVLHKTFHRDFALCLVWRGLDEPVLV